MCRNICNMLFVLFAVVLGLAASKGGVSGNNPLDCYLAARRVADVLCQRYGSFEGLIYATCQLVCGGKHVQLPKDACSRGAHNGCTQELKNSLLKWSTDMKKVKDRLKKI
uniref:Putative ixodes 10 kDa peptide protein n=1 Tax=Ixodes ricinus TaxID=34613 RepID=A0A0K8REC8_IXORI